MIHYSPTDRGAKRIEIPDFVCYWEPQGNGHCYTTCGELVYCLDYKKRGIKKCHICGKNIYDGVSLT